MSSHQVFFFLFFFFEDIFLGFLCLYLDRTAEEKTGKRGERGGMTCSKGPQVESNLGPLREDTASVYGAPALPTEPPGAPNSTLLIVPTEFCWYS